MNTDSKNLEYKFGDYRMSNSQQILFKGENRLPLSTKIYNLLLTLVKNTGQVLSKDEIIDTVWPGQVVTDTALAQQILRLRQVLEDNNRVQPLIETHRGVGYRFTAPVETLKNNSSTTSKKQASVGRWLFYAATTVILLGIWFSTRDTKLAETPTQDFPGIDNAISMAIVPTTNNPDWLNRGGLDYLAELLGRHKPIHAINPNKEWYASGSPEELAIGLTTNRNIDYSLLIGLEELEDGFRATIKLRTENDILATTDIQAETLPELFEKADKWVSVNLSVRDQLTAIDAGPFATTDKYALQSYLQGIFENEVNNNKKRSVLFFQAAVNKDDGFLSAWVKLAAAHLELGDFDKAISIANTQIDRLGDSTEIKAMIELNYIKAMAYYRLRDDENSLLSIQQSIDSISDSKDPYVKMSGLKSLTFLAILRSDWQQAEAFAQENLDLNQKYLPLPNVVAGLNLSLARIKLQNMQTKDARERLSTAINLYEETENSNGMISSLCVLNTLNLARNTLDEGVKVATDAEPWLQKSTAAHDQACFILATSTILNLRGYFDWSQKSIDRMKQIGVETNSDFYPFLAEFLTIHMLYVQNEFGKAMKHVDIMKVSTIEKSNLPTVRYGLYLLDILISSRAMPADEAFTKTEDYIQRFPALMEKFSTEIARAQGHVAVRSGQIKDGLRLLKESEQAFRDRQEIHVANYVGFEILEVLLRYPELEYQDTINRLEANTHYDYLFFKLKAQFLAREGNYLDAVLLMQENKLRANQLWKPEDQLLMEDYQLRSR